MSAPAGCLIGLAAVGAGRVLFNCSGPLAGNAVIFNLATRASALFPYRTEWYSAGGAFPSFDSIGSHWVAGPYQGNHLDSAMLLNWRTRNALFADRDPFSARAYLDLSSSRLGRRLCPPLRRTRLVSDTYTTRARFRPLLVRGRHVLRGTRGVGSLHGRLYLARCGSRRRVALGAGMDATIGAGWVTWRNQPGTPGSVVHARRLSDGATFESAALPVGGVPPYPVSTVRHTADALYASVSVGANTAIWRAPLPLSG